MAIDYGLYHGLIYDNDWNRQNQNAKDALLYQADLTKQAEAQRAAEQQAQQGVQDYLNKAQNAISVAFPADQQRIKDYVEKIKQPLYESLKSNPQNTNQWLQSGGYLDLNKFGDALQNGQDERKSNPIQDAVANMATYRKAIADQQTGLVPNRDQNGNPYDLKAELQKLQNGQTNTLSYPGSYKPVKFDLNDIVNTYGDADHEKRVGATRAELIDHMNHQGVPKSQQMDIIDSFFDKNGKPLVFHKNDNPNLLKDQLIRSQIANNYSNANLRNTKAAGGGGNKEDQQANGYLNLLGGLYNGTLPSYVTKTDPNLTPEGKPADAKKNDNPFTYQETDALNGTVLGKVSINGKQVDNVINGIKRHPDGSLWYRTNHQDWKPISDLHSQIGESYLKTYDAAGGGLKVKNAAYKLAIDKYQDPLNGGTFDYSRYGKGTETPATVAPITNVGNIFAK